MSPHLLAIDFVHRVSLGYEWLVLARALALLVPRRWLPDLPPPPRASPAALVLSVERLLRPWAPAVGGVPTVAWVHLLLADLVQQLTEIPLS